MSSSTSLIEDQMPLPLIRTANFQPPPQVIKPSVTDITLYGDPDLQARPPQNTATGTKAPLSFKDWKDRQDQRAPASSAALPEVKHVRFNDPLQYSKQQIQPMVVIPPRAPNTYNPVVCRELEKLSLYEPSYQPQAVTRHEKVILPAPQPTQCCCRNKEYGYTPPPPQSAPPPPPTPHDDIRQWMTQMQRQFTSMQEQISSLQAQLVQLTKVPSAPQRPQVRDSATQYVMTEPTRKADMATNTEYLETDQTFFNEILGQVTDILQQTDESQRLSDREVKFIESDTSAESIGFPTVSRNNKKVTDMSTFVNVLAEQYLGKHNGTRPLKTVPEEESSTDMTQSSYNYIQKYDLTKPETCGTRNRVKLL